MKIKSQAVAPTAFLHLKGLDDAYLYEGDPKDGKKVGMDMYSPGTAEFAQIEAAQSARFTKNMQENDGKFVPESIEVRRQQAAEDLAKATARFHYIEYDGPDGKPLTGTALFTAVFADPELGHIKEQALKLVGNWGKFKPASTGS